MKALILYDFIKNGIYCLVEFRGIINNMKLEKEYGIKYIITYIR